MEATVAPVVVIAVGILSAYYLAGGRGHPLHGLFGIGVAVMAQLSMTGLIVALGRLGIGHAALLRDPIRPTPVLAAPAADDEAAELEADGTEARLLPENPEARPSLEAADVELALRRGPPPAHEE